MSWRPIDTAPENVWGWLAGGQFGEPILVIRTAEGWKTEGGAIIDPKPFSLWLPDDSIEAAYIRRYRR